MIVVKFSFNYILPGSFRDYKRTGFSPFLATLILLFFCSGQSNASSWMRSEGESYFIALLSKSQSDEFWDKHRKLQKDDCRSDDYQTFMRYEYGYSYYHTLFADLKWESNDCGALKSQGIPDVKFGIRGRLLPFRNGRTWQVSVTIPVDGDPVDRSYPGNGEYSLNAGLYFRFTPDPYEIPEEVRTGGIWSWAIGTKLWTGNVANKVWSYLRWSDQLFKTRFQYNLKLSAEYSFGEDNSNGFVSGADNRRVEDYDVITGTISISRRLTKGSSGHLFLSQDLAGRNTGKDTSIQLGLSKTWK